MADVVTPPARQMASHCLHLNFGGAMQELTHDEVRKIRSKLRSAVVSVSSRRAASPPSTFFAPEVHGSRSSFSERRSILTVASRPGVASRQRKPGFVVRGLFGLGAPELVVIAGVAALLFGPKQLPQLGKKLGQSVKSFQQATKEFESEVKGDSEDAQGNSGISEKTEIITPAPVATPSKTENKPS